MKKLMSISLLIMVMLLLIATTVNATTNSELPQKLYSMGLNMEWHLQIKLKSKDI